MCADPATGTAAWGLWLEPALSVPELVEAARVAEAAGASHVFVADEGTDRDCFVVLAAIAAATSRIHLATGITNPFSRHPVATAAAFASLAELAPGRVVVGLGVGGSRVLDPMGMAPARPFTALRECADVVCALLEGQTVTHRGEFDVVAARLPWSPGPLPLAIAGRGPRVEQLAATRADWVVLAGRATGEIGQRAAAIRAAGAAAGKAPRIAWSSFLGWDDAERERIRPHFTYLAVNLPVGERRALGIPDEVSETVRAVMLRDGPAAAAELVPDAVVERYAVVGDRAGVVARLAEIRNLARPDVFLLPVNDYRELATFLPTAARILAEAGFTASQAGPGDEDTRVATMSVYRVTPEWL